MYIHVVGTEIEGRSSKGVDYQTQWCGIVVNYVATVCHKTKLKANI